MWVDRVKQDREIYISRPDGPRKRKTGTRFWALGAVLGAFVALAFFVIGTPAFLVLLLALVASLRNRFALPSLSGVSVGAGLATYGVLAQAASRCATENEVRPGLTASCTAPDSSTLIFLAAIAIVLGVALGLIAKGRVVPEAERSRTARI
ncbi:MAG: hypothetical protein E6I64_10150 [Chloroflexi bacterium]|nr:MAG: hypothetical protein E6I64_10150 [Chloroflexota bacterium]